MFKQADSVGSAAPDPSISSSENASIPKPDVSNKPPAGQTGPRGLQPRQTYSRVNTGTAPTPDAGAAAQKSMAPTGLDFLPKLSEARMNTTVTPSPSINDMVKAAMAGAINRVDITNEAVRQFGGVVKTASAEPISDSYPTSLINKLADALGYVADQIEKGAAIEISGGSSSGVGPGAGPGHLQVLKAEHNGKAPLAPGQSGGRAASSEPMESGKHGPAPTNAMGTNEDTHHGSWPADVMNGKTAALVASNLERLSKIAYDPSPREAAMMAVPTHMVGSMLPGVAMVSNPVAGGIGAYQGAKRSREMGEKETGRRAFAGSVGASAGANLGGVLGGLGAGGLGAAVGSGLGALTGHPEGALWGAGIGGGLGLLGGNIAGQIHGGKKGFRKAMAVEDARQAKLAGNIVDQVAHLAPAHAIQGLAGLPRSTPNLGSKAMALGKKVLGKTTLASANAQYIREVFGQVKAAEDAINPAHISGGRTGGPVASGTASGEAVPSQPSDVSAQERLIGSNQAAINYTKRDAKSDPLADARRVYDSPVMKDPVLNQVFENSGKAGVKTSANNDAMKIAAARAILSKLATESVKAKKNKESAMGGAAGSPPPPGVPSPAFTQ